jgi:hypothetical protein
VWNKKIKMYNGEEFKLNWDSVVVICKRGKNVLFLIYDNPNFVPAFGKAITMKREEKE